MSEMREILLGIITCGIQSVPVPLYVSPG